MSSRKFHVVRKKARYGPYSVTDLERLANDGRLTWADLVEDDGGNSIRLGDVISDLGYRYESAEESSSPPARNQELPPAVARILGQRARTAAGGGTTIVPRGALRPVASPGRQDAALLREPAQPAVVTEENWEEDWEEEPADNIQDEQEQQMPVDPDGEVAIYRGKPAAWNYPVSMVLVLTSLACGSWLMQYHILYLAAGCGLASFFLFAIEFTRCHSVFLISNQRVEVIRGLFTRSSREVRIRDIRAIDVEKTGWRGLLNIGDVFFSSAGSADEEVTFQGVAYPHRIKKIVRQLQGG
jgi:hypothetical protein